MTVAIVGGGFAGLFTASRLVAAGIDDVVVLEASPHPGGVARTVARDGYILEPAAGSFTLPHPHLSAILADTPVIPAAATARMRHVWTGDRIVSLRPGPAAALAPLVPPRAKLRGLAELLVSQPPGDDDESLDRFCRRRFGNELGRTVAWLAASGVFAGDPTRLSARSAFPALTGLVETEGSVVSGAVRRLRARSADTTRPSIHVPATTMSAVVDDIAHRLGDRVQTCHRVDAVRRDRSRWIVDGTERLVADHVVMTCAPHTAAGLVDGELADELRVSVTAPVVVLGLGGTGPHRIPDGFGVLVGPDAGTATRGILLESSYAPHRAAEGNWLLKVIAGGLPPRPVTEEDDATLVEVIGAEIAHILGTDLEASFVEVTRHAPGIPQYVMGHRRWLDAVEAATPESLHLTGWGYRGVGISHLAADAARIADLITA